MRYIFNQILIILMVRDTDLYRLSGDYGALGVGTGVASAGSGVACLRPERGFGVVGTGVGNSS